MSQSRAAEPGPLDVLPATKWKTVANPSDKVQIQETGGVFSVDYDVNVNQRRRVGHKTQYEAAFLIELKEPIVLSPEQMRICFESRNLDDLKLADLISVLPIIEDEHGERIFYKTESESTNFGKTSSKTGWQLVKTSLFWMTEAGGSAQDIYDAEGGDQNSWPDGKLRFVGFQIRVYADRAKEKQGQRAGKFCIGEIATAGARAVQPEFGYADNLLSKKGTYRIAFEGRAAFQAPPVQESTQTVVFDPESEQSRKQRIAIPIPALQSSWISYRAVDDSGATAAQGELRWDRDMPPKKDAELPAVDLTKPPGIGLVRFVSPRNSDTTQTGGVYRDNDPFRVDMRVFKPEGAALPLKLKWKLTPYAFQTVIEEKEQKIDFHNKAFANISLNPTKEEGRDAYKVRYTIEDASGRSLDSGEYVMGLAHKSLAAYSNRKGTLPNREAIKKHPYFRTTFTGLDSNRGKIDEKESIRQFQTYMEESRQMANHTTYMMEASEFEILPGVFDFSLLDKLMDSAADNGFGITVRFSHTENSPYTWQPYTVPRNFDGSALYGHRYYGAFAMSDPRYVDQWRRAFRAIHDRYATHPAFEGYFVMKPGGEWTIADQPWGGLIADYSWAGAEAFRKYLKEDLGLNLEKLNARWGSSYSNWDEVVPPQPDLKSGSKPDLRPQWADFTNCKLSWCSSWYPDIAQDIRSYDPTHVIIAYGGFSEPLPKLSGLIDYLHNGGNHFLEGDGTLVDIWKNGGVGWITEPHQPFLWAAYGDPANMGWVLDWSIFVATAQAGGGGANLHVYYDPRGMGFSLAAHGGRTCAFDRFEMFKPILGELHGLTLLQPKKEVAVLQDSSTVYTKHRTTFGGRLVDLGRWADLLRTDSIEFERYRSEHESQYRLVVLNPLDEVLSQETIDSLDRMVRNGATLLMSARAGWYSMGKPNESFPLLKQLGINPPGGTFELNQANIAATVEPNQPLGEKLKSVPFITQADMRVELQDSKLAGQEFFRWPYRWIPQADYFGYFRNNRDVGGEVIARFADGGVALSQYAVGKGKVVVLWGTPAMKPEQMKGFMAAVAAQAGVVNQKIGNAIPLMLEGDHADLGRHYALLYHETPGSYVQKIPNVPDGVWFVDDMVSGQRLGSYSSKEMKEKGVSLLYPEGASPLKVLRMIPSKQMKAGWLPKYRQAE